MVKITTESLALQGGGGGQMVVREDLSELVESI
jgi:hypothetical protein